MKIAIVGCGTADNVHASCLMKLPQVEVVGVFDLQEKAAKQLADTCGTIPYTSFDQMISEAKPDVISICAPASLHKEYTLKAAQNGKHVICTTPIATNLLDAQEMIDACHTYGVRLFVGNDVRFSPNYANLKREIKAGAIGKVGVAHMKRTGPYPELSASSANASNVITDLMIFDIDFVRSVLGEVKSVYALNRKKDQHDYALITLRFLSGAIVNLEGYLGHPERPVVAVDFAGNGGIIRFNSNEMSSLSIRKAPGQIKESDSSIPVNEMNISQLKTFIDCIRNEKEAAVTAYDAYKALEIALAAVQSAQTGVPVHMDYVTAGQGGNQNVS
ncbi:gfo/Idh/MocA family oxidoreductase [Paenibacillus sp. LMG 31456]|uniref:Gfo/Idh/MocA family oxidoreductase n=1 Tax=Paenibacillus foliorum TaxID=2654974 RepID=A0A972GU48_9BACL|nr:Gfo/Idh/MocA family oxidoreductase [Paenibacillus foliorum]NOU96919.1 gfo/Idh/MocA family oxidoreductase [Paenibacillus foliorum]